MSSKFLQFAITCNISSLENLSYPTITNALLRKRGRHILQPHKLLLMALLLPILAKDTILYVHLTIMKPNIGFENAI